MSWCLYSCFNFSESCVYQATLLWSVKEQFPREYHVVCIGKQTTQVEKGYSFAGKESNLTKVDYMIQWFFQLSFRPAIEVKSVHAPGKCAQAPRPDRFTLRILQFRSSTARLARGVIFLSSAGACLFAGYFDWGSIHCVIRNHVCVLFHIHFTEIRSTPVLHRNLLTVARAKCVSPRLVEDIYKVSRRCNYVFQILNLE